MTPDARDAFLRGYDEESAKNLVFDLRRELVEYCESDVDILP